MVAPSFPYLLLGLHHIQDVPQVDAGQQLHGGVVFRGGEDLDTVVIRQSELIRERQSCQQTDQQTPDHHHTVLRHNNFSWQKYTRSGCCYCSAQGSVESDKSI